MTTFIFRVSTLRIVNNDVSDLTQEDKKNAIRIYENHIDEYSCDAKVAENGYEITNRFDLYWYAKETNVEFINISIDAHSVNELAERIKNILKKEKVNPIAEAFLYQEFMQLTNVTQKNLAGILDRTQGGISNKIRLLNLPIQIQRAILSDKIKERHGRAILKLEKQPKFEEQAMVVYAKIIEDNLSVLETEDMVDTLLGKEVGVRDNLNIKRVKNNRDYVLPETATIVADINDELLETLHSIKSVFPNLDVELSHGVDRKDYVFLLKLKGLNDGKNNNNN